MKDRPSPIVVGTAGNGPVGLRGPAFRRAAGRSLWAAAGVFLIGSLLDLFVLWVLQRQPGPQWEFAAVASTVEGLSRMVLGVALAYGALQLGDSGSLLAYRILALTLLFIAALAAVLGAVMLSDYFILRTTVDPESRRLFESSVLKTLGLCALYVALLLPIGVMGLKRPRSS